MAASGSRIVRNGDNRNVISVLRRVSFCALMSTGEKVEILAFYERGMSYTF